MRTKCFSIIVSLLAFFGVLLPNSATAQWQTVHSHNLLNTPNGVDSLYYINPMSVKFANVRKGIMTAYSSSPSAAGDRLILRTFNSGDTWDTILQVSYGQVAPGSNIFMPDTNTLLFTTSMPFLLRSPDFGYSWDTVFTPQVFYSLSIVSDSLFYAGAMEYLYRSVDKGNTWTLVPSISVPNKVLYPSLFDSLIGYVRTVDDVFRTIDGGLIWDTLNTNVPSGSIVIWKDDLWIRVTNPTQSSTYIILSSKDRGQSWDTAAPLTLYGYCMPYFVTDSVWYVFSDYHGFVTTNAGKTFIRQYNLSGTTGIIVDMRGADFLNKDTGFVFGNQMQLCRNFSGTDTTIILLNASVSADTIFEPCGKAKMNYLLSRPPSGTHVLHFDTVFGSATPGMDYVALPDSLVFPPGTQYLSIPLTVLNDTLTENTEDIVLAIKTLAGNDTMRIHISDFDPLSPPLNIYTGDTVELCKGKHVLLGPSISGGKPPYQFRWYDNYGQTISTYSFNYKPDSTQILYVDVSDRMNCPVTDSLLLLVHDSCGGNITASANPILVGQSVTFTFQDSCFGIKQYYWIIDNFAYAYDMKQVSYTFSSPGPKGIHIIMQTDCGTSFTITRVFHVGTASVTGQDSPQLEITQTGESSFQIQASGLNGRVTYNIRDIRGRLIQSRQIASSNGELSETLHLAPLSSGMYLIEVGNDSYIRREKFVVRSD